MALISWRKEERRKCSTLHNERLRKFPENMLGPPVTEKNGTLLATLTGAWDWLA